MRATRPRSVEARQFFYRRRKSEFGAAEIGKGKDESSLYHNSRVVLEYHPRLLHKELMTEDLGEQQHVAFSFATETFCVQAV